MNRFRHLAATLIFALPSLAQDDQPVAAALPENHVERAVIGAQPDGSLAMEIFLATSLVRGDRVTAFVEVASNAVAETSAAIDPTVLTEMGYSVSLASQFAGAVAWNAEVPVLYTAVVRVVESGEVLHEHRTPFGFASSEVRKGILHVNGTPVELRGAVYRAGLSPAQIKRINGNAVLVADELPDEKFLTQCDQLGVYVVAKSVPAALAGHVCVVAGEDAKFTMFEGDRAAGFAALCASPGEKKSAGVIIADLSGQGDGLDEIRQVWSPLVFRGDSLRGARDGAIEIAGRSDFASLDGLTCKWSYVKFPQAMDAPKLAAIEQSITNLTDIVARGTGFFFTTGAASSLGADALKITAKDSAGRNAGARSWRLRAAESIQPLPKERRDLVSELKEEDGFYRTSVGADEYRVNQKSGMLTSIRRAGGQLDLDPVTFIGCDSGQLAKLTADVGFDRSSIVASFDGGLKKLAWVPLPDGWVQLSYEYETTGAVQIAGINLGYPAAKILSATTLADGPARVWRDRAAAAVAGIWTNGFSVSTNEAAAAPVASGFFAHALWTRLKTADGTITVACQSEGKHLGLCIPADDARGLPALDIALLDAIPALVPDSKPVVLKGPQRGSLLLHFAPPAAP